MSSLLVPDTNGDDTDVAVGMRDATPVPLPRTLTRPVYIGVLTVSVWVRAVVVAARAATTDPVFDAARATLGVDGVVDVVAARDVTVLTTGRATAVRAAVPRVVVVRVPVDVDDWVDPTARDAPPVAPGRVAVGRETVVRFCTPVARVPRVVTVVDAAGLTRDAVRFDVPRGETGVVGTAGTDRVAGVSGVESWVSSSSEITSESSI